MPASMVAKVKELLGAGHGGERYTYTDDARFGPVSTSRAPDRWVRTTCGYCSVGCGMLLGVKDGTAVAVKGDPDHPVNLGRLCPKGLSEHQTLAAPGRLVHPTVDGRRATWDEALGRMAADVRRLVDEHGPESFAVLSKLRVSRWCRSMACARPSGRSRTVGTSLVRCSTSCSATVTDSTCITGS